MALTKLPKNAFGTGSVDSDKIEDGTIQGVDISGSIANDRLVNSSITFSGSSTALGGSATLAGYLDWQSVITADGSTSTTAVAGEGYIIDTTSASHTINLPASASIGDTIGIKDYAGTFGTNALVIGRNSQLGTNRASVVLVYVDSTKGWLYTNEHNVASLEKIGLISASGGTETTSGDYKIHTFTGDGCFTVSTAGLGPSHYTDVSYLVIAGGGGGGGAQPQTVSSGGAGAGGYREGKEPNSPHTASPLATTGLTVSATTYPITVGGGGAGGPSGYPGGGGAAGTVGSNSIFSTITSAGGAYSQSHQPGFTGGSGSGGGGFCGKAGGAGNTPPVSPPQGNPGGSAQPGPGAVMSSGGGGGAGAAGGDGVSSPGGAGVGGNGVTSSINGTPTTRAGGGGGSGYSSNASGGSGGGGAGKDGTPGLPVDSAGSGSANTGGGGGGATAPGPVASNSWTNGGSGGKGLVIIRYKYQ